MFSIDFDVLCGPSIADGVNRAWAPAPWCAAGSFAAAPHEFLDATGAGCAAGELADAPELMAP